MRAGSRIQKLCSVTLQNEPSRGGYSDLPQVPLIRPCAYPSPHPFGVAENSILWAMAKERSAY
jgi:hypothetical protein